MWGTLKFRLLLTLSISPAWLSSVSSLKIEKSPDKDPPLQVDKDNTGWLPITFPIHRRESPRQPYERRTITKSSQSNWRNINRRESLPSMGRTQDSDENHGIWKRAGWETMAISNFDVDEFYYTTIQVGTPAQSLDVMLDTGSAYLWLQTVRCSPCNNPLVQPQYDGSLGGFNGSSSSTFIGPTDPEYGNLTYFDGSWAAGIYVKDTVKLGEFSVNNQLFLLATSVSNDQWSISGLLGLSWPSLHDSYSDGDIWWLAALRQFEQPEMSFFFTEWRGHGEETIMPGGQFTLGGRNASLYDGEVAFVPIDKTRDYWTIPVLSLMRHGGGGTNKTVPSAPSQAFAMVDTGTTLITGPTTAVDSFFDGAPGALRGGTVDSSLNGTWLLPCNTTLTARFTFGSSTSPVTVIVPATNLLSKRWDIASFRVVYCVSSLIATNSTAFPTYNVTSGDPEWVLGIPFLKSTYTVFRAGNSSEPPSVGFAPLKGVNYTADGNATIGVEGDGVDGNVGDAGVVIAYSGAMRVLGAPWLPFAAVFGAMLCWS